MPLFLLLCVQPVCGNIRNNVQDSAVQMFMNNTDFIHPPAFTEDDRFLGITLNAIIHGKNAHVPTLHFNLRHVVMKLQNGG